MDKKTKSAATGKSCGAATAEQASATSKRTISRRGTNTKMVQNVLLIWLATNIDEETSADCRNTIAQLQRVIDNVNTFTDGDECVEFIDTINDNNRACMIISGSLGQHIVPRVHRMSQVDSIFIFCSNKARHEKWAEDWSKIKGVFTEIAPICEALKKAAQQCEHNAIPMSFMATSGDVSKKKLDQLDCSFMYTQILKDILLTIHFEQKHIKEFTDHCCEQFADIQPKVIYVKEFETKYRNQTPIWWYARESFLYPMLNRALRLMEVDLIIKMGFFISDLHRQIAQLHSDQFNGHQSTTMFTVYRGQGMSTEHFEQMKTAKGGLMAFNNFLSTSKIGTLSLGFAHGALSDPDLVGILFVMTIDPSQSTTPFASVDDVGYFGDKEDEVLFSMHTVFRINDIKSMGENDRLYQVDLTLTSDNDNDLRALTDRIRKETEESQGWDQLGELLLKLGEAEKALHVYETLLDQTTNEIEKVDIYHKIGKAKYFQGEYKEALTFYEKSFKIREQSLPPNHPDLAKSYNKIALVHYKMGEYEKALSPHEKALAIRLQSVPPNHPDLAMSYDNTGVVYDNMGDYSKALSYYEKALAIRLQSLPPNHPNLAISYNNIGFVYKSMGDYSTALSYYEKAFAIRQQSLPPNHPDLASSYNCIGRVYYGMSEYSKALSSYEKSLEIREQSLSPNHPDLTSCYNNIGDVYDRMREYSKALSSYEKALEIGQQSLPPNHPGLASSYIGIGNVYYNLGDYSKALSSYEKALEIWKQLLPSNRLDLASCYIGIGNVYASMGEYSKALSSYEKSLEIREQSLPPNHPDLASSYNCIGRVYYGMGEYSKALSFYERAVDIVQQSLPSDHPDVQKYRRNLDRVEKKL